MEEIATLRDMLYDIITTESELEEQPKEVADIVASQDVRVSSASKRSSSVVVFQQQNILQQKINFKAVQALRIVDQMMDRISGSGIAEPVSIEAIPESGERLALSETTSERLDPIDLVVQNAIDNNISLNQLRLDIRTKYVVVLHKEGKTLKQIGEKIGVHHQTALRYLHEGDAYSKDKKKGKEVKK